MYGIVFRFLLESSFIQKIYYSKRFSGTERLKEIFDIESLFSIEEIRADFPGYDIIELEETEIELNEGLFHNGTGSVIRFVGQKRV